MMSDSKDNIRFEYLFRDEGNYKIFQFVIFSNPERVEIEKFEEKIKEKIHEFGFFYPSEWNLPLETFNEDEETSCAEFVELSNTKEEPTVNYSVEQMIFHLQSVEKPI